MHLTIAAQKAILSNPDSTPERKERALAELRGIPPKDPRHADAQTVLSELGLAVAETAKPGPTPDKPDKRKYMPMTNAMSWLSMNEMQDAVDRFTGELEAESNRLAHIMSEWAATKDETLLDSFVDAAPAFVEKSLAALGMTWDEVRFQLRCWAALKRGSADLEAEKELLQWAENEAEPVLQATVLITTIWPGIERSLKSWNEKADAVGMDRAAFGRLSIQQRERKLYDIGWHPVTGLPSKGEAKP